MREICNFHFVRNIFFNFREAIILQFDTEFLRVGDLCRNKLGKIHYLEN